MENITEVIKTYLQDNGYKIQEIDGEIVTVRYQMNYIHICPNGENKQFVSMMLPGLDEVDEENPLPVLLSCMHVVSQQMVAKAYPIGENNVVATYEFFFLGEEDLKFQLEKGFELLMAAKVKYRYSKDEFNAGKN